MLLFEPKGSCCHKASIAFSAIQTNLLISPPFLSQLSNFGGCRRKYENFKKITTDFLYYSSS